MRIIAAVSGVSSDVPTLNFTQLSVTQDGEVMMESGEDLENKDGEGLVESDGAATRPDHQKVEESGEQKPEASDDTISLIFFEFIL